MSPANGKFMKNWISESRSEPTMIFNFFGFQLVCLPVIRNVIFCVNLSANLADFELTAVAVAEIFISGLYRLYMQHSVLFAGLCLFVVTGGLFECFLDLIFLWFFVNVNVSRLVGFIHRVDLDVLWLVVILNLDQLSLQLSSQNFITVKAQRSDLGRIIECFRAAHADFVGKGILELVIHLEERIPFKLNIHRLLITPYDDSGNEKYSLGVLRLSIEQRQ